MGRTTNLEQLRIATAIDRQQLMRRATVLLVVVVSTVSATGAWIAMFAWFVVRHPNNSAWSQFLTRSTVAIGVAAFTAGVVAVLTRTRWPSRWRWRRQSPDTSDADSRVSEALSALGLAAGLATPKVAVVADDVVNTTVSVKAGAAVVVLTNGACALPSNELAALIAFDLAIVRSPALRRAQSVRASLGVLATVVKTLWVLIAGSFLVCALTGRALPWAVGMLVGVSGLVVTIPIGVVASATAVTLAIAANTIADRDAVAMTFLPDVYLDVLLAMIDDEHLTHTRLTPLVWFERTTIRDDLPAMAASAHNRTELIHRAEHMSALARVPLPKHWPPDNARDYVSPATRRRRARS